MKTLRVLGLIFLLAAGVSVLAQSKDAATAHVDLISIDGSINPAVDDFIRESIARAKSNGARALIIQMDTPGGLLNSTRTIVKEMLGAEVPLMVYVAPSRSSLCVTPAVGRPIYRSRHEAPPSRLHPR